MGQPDYGREMDEAMELRLDVDPEPDLLDIPDFLRRFPAAPTNAADALQQMADTYRERNAVYGSNYRMVGPMMRVLFPQGVPPELLHSDHFHLFELILVKLSRFAVSNLSHVDSIHDAAVYAAMIEAILNEHNSDHRR